MKARSQAAPSASAQQRFVLMTDTDQSLTVVEALLARIGAADLFDDLYISNVRQARKDTGSMWDLVRTSEEPEPGRWLHIGDNEVNDVERSIERGIIPFHVPTHASEAQDVT
jgi:predicted HAD superfamily hydrolase